MRKARAHVFLIENTQNRDSTAIQLTLRIEPGDERSPQCAVGPRRVTQNELNGFLKMYRHLADEGRKRVREGSRDTDTPEVFGTKTSRT